MRTVQAKEQATKTTPHINNGKGAILVLGATVLFRLHREMHRALSLLPRSTQQLRETG
jgi:hypothetical protein